MRINLKDLKKLDIYYKEINQTNNYIKLKNSIKKFKKEYKKHYILLKKLYILFEFENDSNKENKLIKIMNIEVNIIINIKDILIKLKKDQTLNRFQILVNYYLNKINNLCYNDDKQATYLNEKLKHIYSLRNHMIKTYNKKLSLI